MHPRWVNGCHHRRQTSQHYMADANPVMEATHAGLRGPVACCALDCARVCIGCGQVVIGDQYDLVRVPHFGAQAFEHWLDPSRSARVMHHREIDLAGDQITWADGLTAARAGYQFVGERTRHDASGCDGKSIGRRCAVRSPLEHRHESKPISFRRASVARGDVSGCRVLARHRHAQARHARHCHCPLGTIGLT